MLNIVDNILVERGIRLACIAGVFRASERVSDEYMCL